jgi:glycosyltransferase involved in cell wall biosynthesis
MRTPRIIAVHLLNDLSGSPLVFRQALEALQQEGYELHLLTATPAEKGFLTGIPGVHNHSLRYRWSSNKWITLLYFGWSQLVLFFRMFAMLRRDDIVYINTLLPFGAAIAGRLRGCRVVLHIHEVSIRPALLKKWLLFIAGNTADQLLFVSEYVRKNTAVHVSGQVIYNALQPSFVSNIRCRPQRAFGPFRILMVCSLRRYKGVEEFIRCAHQLPFMEFELVLNASRQELNAFFKDRPIPENIRIHTAQTNMHPFYERSSVVVNLSRQDQWVETFGMTLLEAMYYGKPVIAPAVGGVTELVVEGVTGYLRDSRQADEIVHLLMWLWAHEDVYKRMSTAARSRAELFTQESFRQSIVQSIGGLST